MDMAAQNQVGLEAIDPFPKERIAKKFLPRPTDPRTFRWFMMTPDPPADALYRFTRQHILQLGARDRPVPPRASGHARIAEQGAFPIDEKTFRTAKKKPLGEAFIRRIPAVTVVVAGTDQQRCISPNAMQVLLDHHDLDIKIQCRSEIK